MTIAYLDCFSGIAGDMLLAAMVDAGVPLEVFQRLITALNLPEVSISAEKVKRHSLAATYVRVHVDPSTPKKHRHLHHIVKLTDAANLPESIAARSKAVFQKLAEAEALVHASTVEKVHFHEVGAADAIVDIVGAVAGFAHLGVDKIMSSAVPTGSGTLVCDHGVMPVPAPATAQLLRGIPIAACEETGELATPTGVAILATLASEFGPPPTMRVRSVGVGAGTREGKTRPNIMRILLGEASAERNECERDTVTVLETQLDDATGQQLAFALEQILAAGALDAYFTPIYMKKGRPGQLVTVLCRPSDASDIESLIFRLTPTLGVRRREQSRSKLTREHVRVETRFGPVRIKLGRGGESLRSAMPEYEDCAAAAREHGCGVAEVQQEALRAYAQQRDAGSA